MQFGLSNIAAPAMGVLCGVPLVLVPLLALGSPVAYAVTLAFGGLVILLSLRAWYDTNNP